MGIRKASARALYEEGETYVVVPSVTISLLKSVEAAGILLYLLDKPEDWKIRECDIRKRFQGLGRDRYRAAINELKEIGLLQLIRTQGGSGKISGSRHELSAHPKFNKVPGDIHKSEIRTHGGAIGQETHKSENPPGGKSDDLHMNRSFKHLKSDTHGGEKGVKTPRRTRDMSMEENLTDTTWAK